MKKLIVLCLLVLCLIPACQMSSDDSVPEKEGEVLFSAGLKSVTEQAWTNPDYTKLAFEVIVTNVTDSTQSFGSDVLDDVYFYPIKNGYSYKVEEDVAFTLNAGESKTFTWTVIFPDTQYNHSVLVINGADIKKIELSVSTNEL